MAWLVRLAVLGVVVVGGFLFRDLLPGHFDDLRVGDCFAEPASLEMVEDLQHRPCTDTHDAEVIFVGEHPAAKEAAVLSESDEEGYLVNHCLPAFAGYTGLDLLSQDVLDLGYFVPTSDSWREGDRTIICYAARMDRQALTRSVRTAQ